MSFLIRTAMAARARLSKRAPLIEAESVGSFYRKLWAEAAKRLGAEIQSLPEGFLEIRLGERATRLREHVLMIDHPATVALSRSKNAVYRLLSGHGLPVPAHRPFPLGDLRPAFDFLAGTGAPCVVKPRRASHGGAGVTPEVRTRRDVVRAALYGGLFQRDLLIEEQIGGDCYRLLYLDGVLIDAIRRGAPAVVGDGRSSVRQLVAAENRRRSGRGGAAGNRRLTMGPDCRLTLRRAGLRLSSVPAEGVRVRVKTASNEASERDCESVRDRIGEPLVHEGAAAAAALGIRLAGLDVITTDPARGLRETGGRIIDVNASPGIHYHYQTRNPKDAVPVAVPILVCLLGVPAPKATK